MLCWMWTPVPVHEHPLLRIIARDLFWGVGSYGLIFGWNPQGLDVSCLSSLSSCLFEMILLGWNMINLLKQLLTCYDCARNHGNLAGRMHPSHHPPVHALYLGNMNQRWPSTEKSGWISQLPGISEGLTGAILSYSEPKGSASQSHGDVGVNGWILTTSQIWRGYTFDTCCVVCQICEHSCVCDIRTFF